MTYVLAPTLQEIRKAAAIRLNLGHEVSDSTAAHPLLDEFTRQAARELLLEAHWLELRATFDIELEDAQHSYDLPDHVLPGRIEDVYIVDTEGRERQILPDVRPYERGAWAGEDRKGLPQRYDFLNQLLEIFPAPDTTQYVTMRIYARSVDPDPRNNNDRIHVDREALIQRTTLLGKQHFGWPDVRQAQVDHQVYLERVKMAQGTGKGFTFGGRKSFRSASTTRRQRRNRRGSAATDTPWQSY